NIQKDGKIIKNAKKMLMPDGQRKTIKSIMDTRIISRQIEKRKFILNYKVTSAEVHDSQPMFDILGKPRVENESVRGDSAYCSEEIEEKLSKAGFKSNIHEKGYRNKPLTKLQKRKNTNKSKVRARVEHVFGMMYWMKGDNIRSIGIDRAEESIGMINLI
ncbi:MAG: transposase, partial [Spirochaetota bacterium]|nr:transposase [Spirochaetota bacterium]